MNHQLKSKVLSEIQRNTPAREIVFLLDVTPEDVQQVRQAYRDVHRMKRQGVEPRVLYANYGDLLTAQVCGLPAS